MKILLRVGDWSDDGHGKSRDRIVESNLDIANLQKAYEKGVEKIGFDIHKNCNGYEDSLIQREDWDNLIKLGCPDNLEYILDYNGEYDNKVHLDYNIFIDIWIFTAKMGEPELTISLYDELPAIDIGGYGLFYS